MTSPVLPRPSTPTGEEKQKFFEYRDNLLNWIGYVHSNAQGSDENIAMLQRLANAIPSGSINNSEVNAVISAVKRVVTTRRFDPSLREQTIRALTSLSHIVSRL